MRAAIVWKQGVDFTVQDDVSRGSVGPDEVAVRIHAAGLCHTDIALAHGAHGQQLPAILGHEGSGEVIEVGPGVTDFSEGDRVLVNWVPSCGRCRMCVRGQPQLCIRRASTSASSRSAGEHDLSVGETPVIKGMGTATFAEETVLPARGLVHIPDDLPYEIAAMMGCSIPTGMGAVFNAAKVQPGDSVLIIGCGAVGLSAIQGARIAGASTIAAMDPIASRRDLAITLGSTMVAASALECEELSVNDGLGFDVGIDAVGSSATIRTAWNLTRRGGAVVVVGAGRSDDLVEFSAYELFHEEKRLVGSFYGSGDLRRELPRMVSLWRSGQLKLEDTLSRVVDLAMINDAVAWQRDGLAVRVILRP